MCRALPNFHRRSLFRYLLIVALSLVIAPGAMRVARADTNACIEQDETIPSKGGIGGTGQQAKGGIGGTGIVGTVTGFASVCVNGLEVHYDNATLITRSGQPETAAALTVGQIVAIDAAGDEARLIARHIELVNVLEGPLTQAAEENGVIRVMDQRVRIDDSTHFVGLPDLDHLKPGMPLRVSGLRGADNQILATRIEHAPDLPTYSAIGRLAYDGGNPRLGGLPLRTDAPLPHADAEIWVQGLWDGSRLVVHNAATASPPFAGKVEHVVVEGLVLDGGAIGKKSLLQISGFDIEIEQDIAPQTGAGGSLIGGQRVIVSGELVDAKRIVVRHVRPVGSPRQGGATPDTSMQPGDAGMARRMQRLRATIPPHIDRMERIPMQRPGMPMGGMPTPKNWGHYAPY